MNASTFHLHLLSGNQHQTPAEFQLSDTHKKLYEAYEIGNKHGFSSAELDSERFLGTIVLALALTEAIKPVYVAIPKPHFKWALDQVENIGRHVMRHRKKDKDAVLILRTAFQQMRMTSEILREPEPDRWVMFGFRNEDILPEWAKGRLLELEAPRSAEAREVLRIPLPPKPKGRP